MKWILLLTLNLAGAVASTELPFNEALKTIVDRNLGVALQKTNVASTEAKNLPSSLSLLPTVSLEAGQNWIGGTVGVPETSTRRNLGVKAGLNLFKFGADSAAMSAASNENKSQALLLSDSLLKAEAEGTDALFSYIQSSLTVATLKQLNEVRKDAVRIASSRFEKGLIASQEADKFLVDSENSESQLRDAELDLVKSRANLTALLGSSDVAITWPWTSLTKKMAELLKSDAKPAISSRPDVRSLESRLDAYRSRKDQAFGQVFPSLDLSLNYNFYQNIQPAPSYDGKEWVAGVTLSIPLFDKLSNYSNYRVAVETTAAAEIELEKQKRRATSEWISARESLQVALAGIESREKTQAISKKLYEANLQRFKRAIVNANDLRNDQERMYQTETAVIKGWADLHQSLVRLCHSEGKKVEDCLK